MEIMLYSNKLISDYNYRFLYWISKLDLISENLIYYSGSTFIFGTASNFYGRMKTGFKLYVSLYIWVSNLYTSIIRIHNFSIKLIIIFIYLLHR